MNTKLTNRQKDIIQNLIQVELIDLASDQESDDEYHEELTELSELFEPSNRVEVWHE